RRPYTTLFRSKTAIRRHAPRGTGPNTATMNQPKKKTKALTRRPALQSFVALAGTMALPTFSRGADGDAIERTISRSILFQRVPAILPPACPGARHVPRAGTSRPRCRGRLPSCADTREWRQRRRIRCPERSYAPCASRPCRQTTTREAVRHLDSEVRYVRVNL